MKALGTHRVREALLRSGLHVAAALGVTLCLAAAPAAAPDETPLVAQVAAQDAPGTAEPPPAAQAPDPPTHERGPVTNLPLPRYVSLKVAEGNVRRGPSLSHRIDWVYRHRSMPLQITAEFGHWRRVRDRDGAGGWVHYSLLSGVRTVLIEENMTALRMHPSESATMVARAEAGVVARLGRCLPDWCRVTAGRERGWVPKSVLWGVDPDEVRD